MLMRYFTAAMGLTHLANFIKLNFVVVSHNMFQFGEAVLYGPREGTCSIFFCVVRTR